MIVLVVVIASTAVGVELGAPTMSPAMIVLVVVTVASTLDARRRAAWVNYGPVVCGGEWSSAPAHNSQPARISWDRRGRHPFAGV